MLDIGLEPAGTFLAVHAPYLKDSLGSSLFIINTRCAEAHRPGRASSGGLCMQQAGAELAMMYIR